MEHYQRRVQSKAIELDEKLIIKAVSSITVMKLWNGTIRENKTFIY